MFYISSRGSSATTWVAKILNMHRAIVCFNSARAFPPVPPGKTYPSHEWVKEISPKKFIDSLIICEKSCRGEKVFGSIHGYHSVLTRQYCLSRSGKFFYITRDPLERIHSCWILNLNSLIYKKMKNEEIFDHTINILTEYSISNSKYTVKKTFSILHFFKKIIYKIFIKKNIFLYELLKNFRIKKKVNKINSLKIGKSEEQLFLTNHFNSLCNDFFSKENELFNNCDNNVEGLKMEDLVSSKEYFLKKLLNQIYNDENINNKFLDKINFPNIKRVNFHRKVPLKSEQIWKVLPDCLKELYILNFKKYKMENICNYFKYDVSYLKL